jgi:RNA-directed DNA polymerase
MIFREMLDGLPDRPRFNFFSFHDVNPVSGRSKQRTVAAPNDAMKILQRRFLKRLRSEENTHVRARLSLYATSSNSGDSPLKNVQSHRRNRFFYLLDFSNAYGSVVPGQLAEILIQFPSFDGIPAEKMEEFLRKYFFDKVHGLVPGGPASQDLFNLYVGSLIDLPIAGVINRKGIEYTRYIDDLTFSSASPISENVWRAIRDQIQQAGFLINHRKCECIDLKKRTAVITGIGLADGGRMFVPRPYVLKLRGLIHRVLTKGDVEKERIQGMMGVLRQLTRDQRPNKLEQKVLNEYNRL